MFQTFQPEEVPVVAITRKRLVSTFSRQENLHVSLRQLGYVIQGNRWRLANGLLHVPNVTRPEIREVTCRDAYFMMSTTESFGCQLRIGPFIGHFGITKPHS